MVYFIGAGPGAADLITVRGAELLKKADVIIYAGSLVNPALLDYAKKECKIYNSAEMTLEEVIEVMKENRDREVVRLQRCSVRSCAPPSHRAMWPCRRWPPGNPERNRPL